MSTVQQMQQKLKKVTQEKSEQEQELIKARLEWATLELQNDRLMQELLSVRHEHDALVREKYEETLKLSIMAKESEIAESSRQKKKELKKKAVGIVVKKGFGAVFKQIKNVMPSMEYSPATDKMPAKTNMGTGD